ncbi:hypothetical protein ElyMa_005730800 [Elysia marginata]|uniref:Uncharacterized protein n=1 Tax=Elysia marginata TaxID=1093978 RepID=A0AAV4FKT7_9GAST|nr:hypothetical protein ElyMa_005730800 [Elysia marginata]
MLKINTAVRREKHIESYRYIELDFVFIFPFSVPARVVAGGRTGGFGDVNSGEVNLCGWDDHPGVGGAGGGVIGQGLTSGMEGGGGDGAFLYSMGSLNRK